MSLKAFSQVSQPCVRCWHDGLKERIEADLNFHSSLVSLTGNETLVPSWQSLEGTIHILIRFDGKDRAVSNMKFDRHTEIVDVIETGNPSRARTTIITRMDESPNNLVA